jgi:DNA-binding beta-propeller fold protein YncE
MKTRIVICVSLIVVVLAMANLFVGHAQQATGASAQQLTGNGAPPLSNPLKVALLKWYQANTVSTTFPVGTQPQGVAFDGASIWVANQMDNTLTKISANDGTVLGTFGADQKPIGVAFDGANLWVGHEIGIGVSKVRASDGKFLGTFKTGNAPFYPAFDGQNIWVPNLGDGTITILRASDGKTLGTISPGGAYAAAFDGTYMG